MKPDIDQKIEQLADAIPANDSFVNDVMSRIKNSPVQPSKKQQRNIVLRRILMKNTIKFTAAAVILVAATLSLTVWDAAVPNVMASELLTSAIEAVGNTYSIHIKAKLRTSPQDNFSHIDLERDFVPVKVWAKQSEDGRVRMRIDKPRRQLAMDGQTATMMINHNYVTQIKTRAYGCFNSDWLTRLIAVNELLENELKMAKDDPDHEISIYHEEINGQKLLVLQRCSQAKVSKGDYLRNKFIRDAVRTFFYYFDPETNILVGMQMLVHAEEKDVVVFEITDIQYNPEIEDSHFTLEIPKDAIFHEEPKVLPDNEKYVKMTPEEAAETIFTSCAEENWDEVLKFEAQSRISEGMKQSWGGLEIISIGEPFQSDGYGGWFVPYEIRVKDGRVVRHNLALRDDNAAKRWVIDGGRIF